MFKFYGQFDPSVDRFIFERYFPDKNIRGTFVECGAYDGQTECSCKFFEESMGWKGYNVEPVPWIFEQLKANRPHSTNLNFALSNINGQNTFRAVNHPQFGMNCTNGSLEHTPEHNKWLEEIGCDFVDVEVQLRTWRDFVEMEGVRYVDLLVLDVEGHELSVIAGMHGAKVLPDLICIEVGHLDFEVIRLALSDLGYIYDISSHVNAFFVKASAVNLFAMRRAAANSITSGDQSPEYNTAANRVTDTDTLRQRISFLEGHIHSLEGLLAEIQQSRSWKLIEGIRKFKKRN